MQSMHITTKVVSTNPALGEMYSIQHYVIKFVGDRWFYPDTNKTDSYGIIEILLKEALNTINYTATLVTVDKI